MQKHEKMIRSGTGSETNEILYNDKRPKFNASVVSLFHPHQFFQSPCFSKDKYRNVS